MGNAIMLCTCLSEQNWLFLYFITSVQIRDTDKNPNCNQVELPWRLKTWAMSRVCTTVTRTKGKEGSAAPGSQLTCCSPNPHNHNSLVTENLTLRIILPVQGGRQSFQSLRSCAGRSAGLAFRWAADLWGSWSPGRRSAHPWSWTAAGWPRSWLDPSVGSQARRWCRLWGCLEHKLQPSSPAQEHREMFNHHRKEFFYRVFFNILYSVELFSTANSQLTTKVVVSTSLFFMRSSRTCSHRSASSVTNLEKVPLGLPYLQGMMEVRSGPLEYR